MAAPAARALPQSVGPVAVGPVAAHLDATRQATIVGANHVRKIANGRRGANAPLGTVRMTSAGFHHAPVLLHEVSAAFAAVPGGWALDATVGGGGHAEAILAAHPHIRLIGLDQDPSALAAAALRLAPFGDRVRLVRARFDALAAAVADVASDQPQGANRPDDAGQENRQPQVSAVLFDLGVSSPQLDRPERGFSYRSEGPLDMRMNPDQERMAADLVNEASIAELAASLATYGDERFSGRIARAIVAARPLFTTSELAAVVTRAIPAAARRTGGHPAKRTFQALRIAVNDELAVLSRALDAALDVLAPGGRCVVIAYHSGEDRIVKSHFRTAETGGCTCPVGLPCQCGALPRGRTTRRGVIRPSAAEVAHNPRSESARMRVFERFPLAPTTATPSRGRER